MSASGYFNEDFHKPSTEGHPELRTCACSPEELWELEQEDEWFEDELFDSLRSQGKSLG